MTARALRRVKAVVANLSGSEGTLIRVRPTTRATDTRWRALTVADLRAVVALAEHAAEAERRIAEREAVWARIERVDLATLLSKRTPRAGKARRCPNWSSVLAGRCDLVKGHAGPCVSAGDEFKPPPRAGKRAER